MTDAKFEHEALGKIVAGLKPDNDRPLVEVKADLIANGYDPDAFAARLQKRVNELTQEVRLSWQAVGDAKQEKMNTILAALHSWVGRSATEIDRCFADIRSGQYGNQAQLKLQTAFKNVTHLPIESKAAFLDEVDILLTLHKEQEKEK